MNTKYDEYNFLLQEHNKRFRLIESRLNLAFSAYVNRTKIIKLLDIWLYFASATNAAYGHKALEQFLSSDFSCANRFAIFLDLKVNLNNKISKPVLPAWTFPLANLFSHLLIPGAKIDSANKKFRWRFAQQIIGLVPREVDISLKELLTECVVQYFESGLTEDCKKLLGSALPEVFYCRPVLTSNTSPLVVEGSPWSLIDFHGLENIFLVQRSIKLIGSQHGGGHNSYISEVGEDIEEELADVYYGWGLSTKHNHRQTRYSLRGPKAKKDPDSCRRVLWVEKGAISSWARYIWPYQFQALHEHDSLNYIYRELIDSGVEYSNLPHSHNSFRSPLYDGKRSNEINNVSGRGEDIIRGDDIVIFDIITSSLIHFCIEHEIVFIFVVARESYKKFTPKQCEWFDLLRQHDLAFFNDEKGSLAKRLRGLVGSNLKIPHVVRSYHNSVFII